MFFFKCGRVFISTQKSIEVFFRGKRPPKNKHFLNVSAPVSLNLLLCWSEETKLAIHYQFFKMHVKTS